MASCTTGSCQTSVITAQRRAPRRCRTHPRPPQQQQQHSATRLPLLPRASASAADGNTHSSSSTGKPDWGAFTERLVAASSLPFTILVLPQVLQNQANIAAGALSTLAAISWVGYSAGLCGNALMCVHLASRGEATAVNVQLIGIASTLLILGQLWFAQVMPTRAFAGALTLSAVVGVAGALRSRGRVSDRQWLPFEALASLFGVVAVPLVSVLWLWWAPGGLCHLCGWVVVPWG